MANVRKTFGANVRAERERIGISQEELAFRCNLHRTYIGSVERGERNISIINIVKLAKALGVNTSILVSGIEEQSENG